MDDGHIYSEHGDALNDSEICFTINLNESEFSKTIDVSDGDGCNITLVDQSTSTTSSADDGCLHHLMLMHSVLENWLVHSILHSPNHRLSWVEVLSLLRSTTSSLLLSWYMTRGPEGLFHYFTSNLPGSVIICHNHANKNTTASQSTPPITITMSSNVDHLEQVDQVALRDTETTEHYGGILERTSELIATTSSTHFLPEIDSVYCGKNLERVDNAISRDSNSKSFGSFITFQSYLDTNSMDSCSIKNEFDDDDDDDDEYIADIRDVLSITIDKSSVAHDDQYSMVDEESGDDESTVRLSPTESPDYKNYSMNEFIFYPETVRWYHCQWKQNITIWLLNLLQERSSMKVWYEFVVMEFMNTFGVASTTHVMHWISKEIPDVTIARSSYDCELYVYQSCNYKLLQNILLEINS